MYWKVNTMVLFSNRSTVLALSRAKYRCHNENNARSMYLTSQLLHEKSHQDHPHFSKNNANDDSFESAFAKNFIPTSLLQRTFLSLGSAGISLADPARGDMIATLGETTGTCALRMMLQNMENSTEGSAILSEKPRINSETVNINKLQILPEGTLGKAYSNFLLVNGVSPDTRAAVQFVEDIELAYVMQRYREVHDLIHTILQMRTNMLGEVTVKWIEAIQTKLPMCIGGAVFGSIRLSKKQRQKYITHYLPWAIKTGWESQFFMNIYFEKRWDQPLEELQKELNIEPLEFEKETYVKAAQSS